MEKETERYCKMGCGVMNRRRGRIRGKGGSWEEGRLTRRVVLKTNRKSTDSDQCRRESEEEN